MSKSGYLARQKAELDLYMTIAERITRSAM